MKRKYFLYNKQNPRDSFDVYKDTNKKNTINIKYSTVEELKKTINKLEKLYKTGKYSHKRISQVGMIIKVRLGIIYKYKERYKGAKNIKKRLDISKKYFTFLKKRTLLKNKKDRINFTFYL
jgi:hypothetical protein